MFGRPAPSIWLEPELLTRCDEHGAIAAREGWYTTRRSWREADKDPVLLSRARKGECAHARWLKVPITPSGEGWDVRPTQVLDYDVVKYAYRMDVKTIVFGRTFLIWPVAKIDMYDDKAFDGLVLVIADEPKFEIVGWVSKERFKAEHLVAGPDHEFLDPGTWFMHRVRLDDIWALPALFPRNAYQQRSEAHGAPVGDGKPGSGCAYRA